MVRRNRAKASCRLVLPNGAVWSFLWEGAQLREDESVRQSAYVGFHKTRQLVLEADVAADAEVGLDFHPRAGLNSATRGLASAAASC